MQGFNFSMPIDYMFENNQVEKVYFGLIKMWPRFDLKYLTIHSLDDNNIIKFSLYEEQEDVYYSLNDGAWTRLNLVQSQSEPYTIYYGAVAINNNDRLKLKMVKSSSTPDYDEANITATKNYKVYGNAMSIVYGDDFLSYDRFTYKNMHILQHLFAECDFDEHHMPVQNPNIPHTLVDAKYLSLPVTNLLLSGSTTIGGYYDGMFYDCQSLVTAPELPATELSLGCYFSMFHNCHSLTKAPELPATTLKAGCYGQMFYNCTSLTTAPELPATTLADSCYSSMFQGCTNLNYIKCLATDISALLCTNFWTDSVSSTGTFIKDVSMQNWTIGVDGIPNGWTIQDYSTYEDEYFTIEAINNNTQISFLARGSISSNLTDKLKYSLDDGATWNNFTTIIDVSGHPATDLMTLNSGDRIMLKAQNLDVYTEGAGNSNGAFTILTSNAGDYNVSGNIMSLAYGDNFRGKKSLAGLPSYYFANLFNPLNYQHNLVDASNLILPATTLSDYCYYRMFNLCHQLTTAPELPATTLANYCYYCMFSGCTSLTTAPSLPATTLADYCYLGMFDGCSNLSHITCLATDISALLCTDSWTDGVSQTGTFVKSPNMSNWTTGINGIPSGWTVQDYGGHDYSQDYLTFEALESGNFTWTDTNNNNSIYYSLDDGSTWTQLTSGSSTPIVSANSKVLFKASGLSANGGIGKFSSATRFNAMGNIMSLQDGDNFSNSTSISNNRQFQNLFNGCTRLVDASNLVLPATTLKDSCYNSMFNGCTSLTTAPSTLPATTANQYCYYSMFKNCTSLTTAPSTLSATTLQQYCYAYMFQNCTSLTIAPSLPATTLDKYCYSSMFSGCSSLTTAPALPATTLASNCYAYMFQNCTSLTIAPSLPATTLVWACYSNMFVSCTSLTESPALPATTLASNCYANMFYGCSNLSYITCLATDISASSCTNRWVHNVKTGSSCIFTKAASMQDWTRGTSGIPSGWTVQNAS